MAATIFTNQEDSKELKAHASLSSTSSDTLCLDTDSTSSFHPNRTLKVNALGIRAVRLPFPSSQTEILVMNLDGSEAYVSTRSKRCSGNSILSSPKTGSLIQTDYFFGPTPTVLRILQSPGVISQEVKVIGRWASRSTSFISPKGIEFKWEYAKVKDKGERVNLLALQMINKDDEKESRRIAQLSRGRETRTPGTSACRAGNGGELQIDDGALDDSELTEPIVVATCLVMLKREIDRRRMIQCAMLAGAGGGC
jgi:hypothetical protein